MIWLFLVFCQVSSGSITEHLTTGWAVGGVSDHGQQVSFNTGTKYILLSFGIIAGIYLQWRLGNAQKPYPSISSFFWIVE